MKKQNRRFGIKGALILVLGLTLIPGYAFAQTITQYAYTANRNAAGVSAIRTADGVVQSVSIPNQGQGIDLSDDDLCLVVTQTGCSPTAASCASLVQTINLAVSAINVNPANFVAITPALAGLGTGCRYAYVTSGGATVSQVTICGVASTGTCTAGTIVPISLPQNPFKQNPGPIDPPSSFGVAIANNGAEAWVTDANSGNNGDRPFVYAIDTSTGKIDPVQLACSTTCQNTSGCCPPFTPQPRHITAAYVSSTEYRMYVTDAVVGNKAVWPIKNTINQNGTITRTVMDPIRGAWANNSVCDLNLSFTYGIANNYDVTYPNPPNTAYVTAPGINNRLYTINLTNSTAGCAPGGTPYPTGTFFGPRGVAWLINGQAYVGNDSVNKVTVIQTNPNLAPGAVMNLPGNPLGVTVTHNLYTFSPTSPLAPLPSLRVR